MRPLRALNMHKHPPYLLGSYSDADPKQKFLDFCWIAALDNYTNWFLARIFLEWSLETMAWLNFRQSGILADRYFDILLGDLKNTLLLLFQAPIIAGLIVLVWRNVEEPTNTLYFVLVLTSIWFGCSNASRELVKERAIFFR